MSNARGDQRSRKSGSIGKSAWREVMARILAKTGRSSLTSSLRRLNTRLRMRLLTACRGLHLRNELPHGAGRVAGIVGDPLNDRGARDHSGGAGCKRLTDMIGRRNPEP